MINKSLSWPILIQRLSGVSPGIEEVRKHYFFVFKQSLTFANIFVKRETQGIEKFVFSSNKTTEFLRVSSDPYSTLWLSIESTVHGHRHQNRCRNRNYGGGDYETERSQVKQAVLFVLLFLLEECLQNAHNIMVFKQKYLTYPLPQ